MSVRNSLLAILADGPTHGYGLKSRFERSTGRTWPLNVGQVYTTLGRLERDGLVAGTDEDVGDGEGSRQIWRLTDRGRETLEAWYATPVEEDPPSRDELALKVLLAVAADGMDVQPILQAQRVATMERLQQYTKCKRDADPDRQLPWVLLLDSLILKTQAELAWIDRCDEALRARDEHRRDGHNADGRPSGKRPRSRQNRKEPR